MKRTFRFFILFAAIIFFGSADLLAQLDGKGNAPDFTLTDIDGNEHHLYEYLDSGIVVVIDFFAVWCGICQSNTPVLENLYEKYGPEGSMIMELLSLESDNATTNQQVRDFVLNFNVTNPHINDTHDTESKYSITGVPYYYVVAPDRSYKVFPGIQMNLEEELSDAIENSPGLRDVEHDARLTGFSEPTGTYCNTSITPKIEIQNYGKNEIHELTLDIFLDGSLEYTIQFTDTLLPYEYAKKTLPEINNINHGWHDIEFSIASVNSNPDAEDNNGISSGSFLFLEESESVVIQVTTDTYPSETLWEVVEDGKVAAERQSFNLPRTTFSDTICLEDDHCYTINIYDRFGDGLSNGGIMVFYKEDTIVNIDSDSFNGAFKQAELCLQEGTSGVSIHHVNIESPGIYPNPTSGEIYFRFSEFPDASATITILDIYGKVLYEEYADNLLSKKSLDLSAFSDGIIFLRIALPEQIITKKILIQK